MAVRPTPRPLQRPIRIGSDGIQQTTYFVAMIKASYSFAMDLKSLLDTLVQGRGG
jgi:hypothetical protein